MKFCFIFVIAFRSCLIPFFKIKYTLSSVYTVNIQYEGEKKKREFMAPIGKSSVGSPVHPLFISHSCCKRAGKQVELDFS